MKKLIFALSLILTTLSFSEEVVLTKENIWSYHIKENGKIHRIKANGHLFSYEGNKFEWFYFDDFILYLKSKNITLVKKDSIKFKVEEE